MNLLTKETRAYLLLCALVICGTAGSLITAPKLVDFGVQFPFSNIVFAALTYPMVDCICELWGKQAARQAMWMGLASQLLICFIIQLSILAPHPSYWEHQYEYQTTLAMGMKIVLASFFAFAASQMLDIFVYQRIKEATGGKYLWLRSNVSTYLGQILDSLIFIGIMFFDSDQKWTILWGSISIKVFISFLMTPFIYLLIHSLNRYLNSQTLAFKVDLICGS